MDVFVRDRVSATTERVSVSSGGDQANDRAEHGSISADGRYVVFISDASNLVDGDTNRSMDVFVRDRLAGTTELASLSSSGAQAHRDSYSSVISADGRFVVFASGASKLVDGDTNGRMDVFVRDRAAGTTERASVGSHGEQANDRTEEAAISADGRFVLFDSAASNLVAGDTNRKSDVFVRDRVAGTTERASVGSRGAQANGGSDQSAISADGRLVVFDSGASNLVAGDTNRSGDVFVRDRVAGTTGRASLGSRGAHAKGDSERPAISADGRFVVFDSDASNLVAGDTNRKRDVYVRDRVTGTTTLISVARR